MRIPSHQIYNILNIYSKQVSKNGTSSLEKFNGDTSKFDRTGTSASRYRKSITEKVTGDIISKITCVESNNQRSQRIAEKLRKYERKNGRLDERNEDTFVFNAIDESSKKTKNTLLIDKSSLLAKNSKQKTNKENRR